MGPSLRLIGPPNRLRPTVAKFTRFSYLSGKSPSQVLETRQQAAR